MTKIKAYYGNVILEKRYCNYCEREAFVIDAVIQCCDRKIEPEIDETIKIRRETETSLKRHSLSVGDKTRILKSQHYKCHYCGSDLRIYPPVFDHFVPFGYSGNDKLSNRVASCGDCNLLKSGLVFDTAIEVENRVVKKSKKRKKIRKIKNELRQPAC